jgi:hypothetical protein
LVIDRVSFKYDTQLAPVLLIFARELTTMAIWKSSSNPRGAKTTNCIDLTFEIVNRQGSHSKIDRKRRRRRKRRGRKRWRRRRRSRIISGMQRHVLVVVVEIDRET